MKSNGVWSSAMVDVHGRGSGVAGGDGEGDGDGDGGWTEVMSGIQRAGRSGRAGREAVTEVEKA